MATSKKQKLIWYGVGVAFLAITVCREAGWFDFSLFRNNIQSTTNATWTDQSYTTINVEKGACDHGSMRNVPVEVLCDGDRYGDTGKCNPVVVLVNNMSYGFVYTPLIKSADFSARASCSGSNSFFQQQDSTATFKSISLSGRVDISGTITVYGFMSGRQARKDIRQYVMKEIYNQTRLRLQSYP